MLCADFQVVPVSYNISRGTKLCDIYWIWCIIIWFLDGLKSWFLNIHCWPWVKNISLFGYQLRNFHSSPSFIGAELGNMQLKCPEMRRRQTLMRRQLSTLLLIRRILSFVWFPLNLFNMNINNKNSGLSQWWFNFVFPSQHSLIIPFLIISNMHKTLFSIVLMWQYF